MVERSTVYEQRSTEAVAQTSPERAPASCRWVLDKLRQLRTDVVDQQVEMATNRVH